MLGAVLGIILKGLEIYVDRVAKNEDVAANFYAFVNSLGDRGLIPVKTWDNAREQAMKLEYTRGAPKDGTTKKQA